MSLNAMVNANMDRHDAALNSTHIAFVAPFPPPYGGMAARFQRLTAILGECGYLCEKIPIKWVDGQGAWRLPRRVGSFLRCAWLLMRTQASIVHCVTGSIPHFYMMSIVLLAARLSRRRVILSIGGGSFVISPGIGSSLRKMGHKAVLALPHLIIPCNEQLEDEILELGVQRDRVERISNALPDEVGDREQEELPQSFTDFCEGHRPLVLYVGSMIAIYGLLHVIDAVHELRHTFPDVALVAFVKKDWDARFAHEVKSKIKNYGLDNAVTLHASVPWAVAAMKHANVMVRAKDIGEGDSRAVREALAVGLPVVASDAVRRPDKVLLYKAGDAKDLSHVLTKVLHTDVSKKPYIDPEGEKNIRRYDELYTKLRRN